MKGVPLAVIAAQLGHADIRMVEKHYGHLAPNYVADTVYLQIVTDTIFVKQLFFSLFHRTSSIINTEINRGSLYRASMHWKRRLAKCRKTAKKAAVAIWPR